MTIVENSPDLSRRYYSVSHFQRLFGKAASTTYKWLAIAEAHGARRIGPKGGWRWQEAEVIQALQEAWD